MKTALKIALPLIVIVAGAVGARGIVGMREAADTAPPRVLPPLVRAHPVSPETLTLDVKAQGTVVPRTESVLTAEVSGRVLSVSPSFAGGGFFEAGEVLVEIDPADYRQALASARSLLAQSEVRLAQERAQADVARREWEALGSGDPPSPLTLRTLQVAEAEAAVESARAQVERAERDLERTKVTAPFAGRIRSKAVDIGQFVNRGAVLASAYSVDVAEVRLPVPDADLAHVEVPLGYRNGRSSGGTPVEIAAEFAGDTHTWQGRIVRTEGEIDPRSRVVTLVAQVDDPYDRGRRPDRPPLAVGMFVDATIRGRVLEDAFVVPREAFRDDDTVVVIDDEQRLRLRDVGVAQARRETVVVRDGLSAGERVLVSPLDTISEGMLVRTDDSGSTAAVDDGGAREGDA